MLNDGKAPVQEPRLQATIDAADERLSATGNTEAAVKASDVTFIIVPTPSDEDGAFSNRHVLSAIEAVGKSLRREVGDHEVA